MSANIENPAASKAVDASATIFRGVKRVEWRRAMDYAVTGQFEAGETIIKEGENNSAVFILTRGELEVVKSVWLLGKHRIAVIPEGSVFGEIAFFDQTPRKATVRAITEGSYLKISRQSFEDMLDEEPALAKQLLFDIGKALCLRYKNSVPPEEL